MRQMFESATLKLTIWYLGILMFICLFFSVIIYQISSSEVRTRLNIFNEQFNIPETENTAGADAFLDFRKDQLHEAEFSLFIALFYSNLTILLIGGIGSYLLARRTLRPIEEAHETQARFTSDASHELRTPLAIMKSEIEVALQDKNTSKAELREIMESNLEEVNRLAELSQTLLQLSRDEFDGVEMKRLALAGIIKKAATSLDAPMSRLNIDVSEKTTIKANKSSLVELFVILIDNALRYSPENSPVNIKAVNRPQSVKITINNQGSGIAAADLPHIFERFYRGDKARSTRKKQSGYGLGLSLAKKITELHNGTIEITSKPDAFTTVTLRFKK